MTIYGHKSRESLIFACEHMHNLLDDKNVKLDTLAAICERLMKENKGQAEEIAYRIEEVSKLEDIIDDLEADD